MAPCQTLMQAAGLAAGLLCAGTALAGGPTIGGQVRIDVGGAASAANETTASASELFPDRIVAGWNDYRESGVIRSGFAVSFDGGQSWTDFLLRPPPANQASVEGDPMVTHDDRTGTLWLGAISFAGNGGIYVSRLDPGDTEFQPSVMADVGGVDKGWMAAGPRPLLPDTTRLYIAYNLGIIWSDDMGDSWTNPISLGSGIGFLPRVGPNGEVYVAYWDFSDGVKLKRSYDGTTYTTHTIATRMDVWGTQDGDRFPGQFRVPSMNYFDVDPVSGHLYAVYFDTTNIVDGNSNVDLYFTKSVDEGTSWTVPVVINGDADPPGDQFFSWLEVDRQGRIHIVFLDSRNVVQDDDAPNGFFDAYYTYSDDEGQTWNEFRLTPVSWSSSGSGFIGDYSGMAVAGDRIYPVYIDMHEGDQNIYTNVIELAFDCPWDCAVVDGVVGIEEFLAVIGQWGQVGVPCDFDGGGIGISEFLAVIGNWGPCP